MTPEQVARRFYDAFVAGKVDALERLYAPTVRFRDEVFSYSDRRGALKMWRKLLSGGGGRFAYQLLRVEGDCAYVRWTADYRLLGRPVHNVIDAELRVKDGLIVEHIDRFSWAKWSRQALPLGSLPQLGPMRWLITRALRAVIDLG
jgi:ketosteroid isomerase-like protein